MKKLFGPGGLPLRDDLPDHFRLYTTDGVKDYSIRADAITQGAAGAGAQAAVDYIDANAVNFPVSAPVQAALDLKANRDIVFNVKDHGVKGDGSDETAAIQAAVDAWKVGTLDSQYAHDNAKVLYFPAGRYKATGLEIVTQGTGCVILGDGRITKLDGISITVQDRFSRVQDLEIMGTGGVFLPAGLRLTRIARRGSKIINVSVRDREIGCLYDGGGVDSIVGCLFSKNGVNFKLTSTLGVAIEHCEFTNALTGDNIEFAPAPFAEGYFFGEAKFVNCIARDGRYNLHIKGSLEGAAVECQFTNCTFTGAYNRTIEIVSIADLGGGQVEVTTSAPHKLLPGTGAFAISGTSGYDTAATYCVNVTSPTKFVLTATFTGTSTGTISIPGWDVYIDAQDAPHMVNDMWFTGGNINFLHIKRGYNINFVNTRLKQEVWIEAGSRISFYRNRRGRQLAPFADIPVGGPGAVTGWAEVAYTDGSSNLPGAGGMEIAAPSKATALGANSLPTLNAWRVMEDRIDGAVAGSKMIDLRSDAAWLGGEVGSAGLRARKAANAVNYVELVGQATTVAPQILASGSDTNISLAFTSKGTGSFEFTTGGGRQLRIFNTTAAVNHFTLQGGATGSPVLLAAAGTDTDIDLRLLPKGAGVLRFGAHSALGAEVVTGFISIKDSGGTTRKLAVVS